QLDERLAVFFDFFFGRLELGRGTEGKDEIALLDGMRVEGQAKLEQLLRRHDRLGPPRFVEEREAAKAGIEDGRLARLGEAKVVDRAVGSKDRELLEERLFVLVFEQLRIDAELLACANCRQQAAREDA